MGNAELAKLMLLNTDCSSCCNVNCITLINYIGGPVEAAFHQTGSNIVSLESNHKGTFIHQCPYKDDKVDNIICFRYIKK